MTCEDAILLIDIAIALGSVIFFCALCPTVSAGGLACWTCWWPCGTIDRVRSRKIMFVSLDDVVWLLVAVTKILFRPLKCPTIVLYTLIKAIVLLP